MNIYIFGNGNISFADFKKYYEAVIEPFISKDDVVFSLCDFRGVDTMAMELLKCGTKNVCVYHIGEKPRYFPDTFRTKAGDWEIIGGFTSDRQRDQEIAIKCTHYIAIDFNSDNKRKSGTQKNIEFCESLGKIKLS